MFSINGGSNLNLSTALGAMRLIANIGREGFLDGLGVSRGDFDRLVGSDPWLSVDRNRMTTTLQTLLHASVDAIGLPRFNLPAEYVAAGIATFVHPVNAHASCVFATGTAEEMGRAQGISQCTPEQLFALVVQLFASEVRGAMRAQFEKNTSLALEKIKKVLDIKK